MLREPSQTPLDATRPSLPRTGIPNKRSSRPVHMDLGNSCHIFKVENLSPSYFRGDFLAPFFEYQAGTNGFDGKLQVIEGVVTRSLANPKFSVSFVCHLV